MRIVDEDKADVWFTFADEAERDACYHPGDCEAGCKATLKSNRAEMKKITRKKAIALLRPTGGWTHEELEAMSLPQLCATVLWIAAGYAVDCSTLEAHISTY